MKYGKIPALKTYYSISEVSEKTGVAPHVLRFWESAIPMLRPRKNRGGNRVYREKDIELVNRIKHLVQIDKLSLSKAQEQLRRETTKIENSPQLTSRATVLLGLHEELRRTLAMLKGTRRL